MKKILLLSLLTLSITTYGQDNTEINEPSGRHEVTLNGLTLVAFEWFDVSYNYLINEESSFGVNLQVGLDADANIDSFRKFSITPNYRHYFGKKYAAGFYVEGFASLINYDADNYYDIGNSFVFREENFTDLGLGISIGGKFLSKRGFVADVFLGVGRYIGDGADLEAFARLGISLGYRF